MEQSRILRLLTLHVVFLSPLLKSCSAASFSFTMRDAAYVVAAIGVIYIILCLAFLFIICRILPSNNKKCRWCGFNYCSCHKGKVCPTMPSSSVHKGKDFMQQDRFTPRKKSTIVQPVAKTPNLRSIPEDDDNIISNPVAFEEESMQSSLPYLNRTTSTSTAITTVQDDLPFERSPTSSPLQSSSLQTNSQVLAEFFEKKAKENMCSELDPGYSSSPLMNEIALEIGMLKGGKTSEFHHPNQATLHEETAFNDEKKVDLKQTGKADKKDNNTRLATTSKSHKLPPLLPSSSPMPTHSPTNKSILKDQSQNAAEELSKQGVKDDVSKDEFVIDIEPPNVLGSSDTAPVITSPVIAVTPPLPPVKLKRLHEVDSSSLHKLDYFNKLGGTPDTRSLPNMVKGDGNGVTKRTTLYSKQMFQTEVHYTPPLTSAKNKTKRAPQLVSSLTAASSAKNITTSHQNSASERAISSHPNINKIGRGADRKVTATTSDTVQYIKADSMRQKSEVCVVEEAGSGNELTLI